jgi:hypothetical protein
MFAIRIIPANHELIAALNNGVIPEIEEPVAHFLVCAPGVWENPQVFDVVEIRKVSGPDGLQPAILSYFHD